MHEQRSLRILVFLNFPGSTTSGSLTNSLNWTVGHTMRKVLSACDSRPAYITPKVTQKVPNFLDTKKLWTIIYYVFKNYLPQRP